MNEEQVRKRREELRKKNRENKGKAPILPIFLTVILVVAISVLSFFYYMTTPVDKSNNNDITIEIKENYGSAKIAEELKNKGLIRNQAVFKLYTRIKSDTFYVGSFSLKPSMSMAKIIDELSSKDKAKSANSFAVIEGDSILKLAQKLEKTKLSSKEFLEKVNDAEFIKKLQKQFPELITDDIYGKDIKYALEGYLYPAIYNIEENETVE